MFPQSVFFLIQAAFAGRRESSSFWSTELQDESGYKRPFGCSRGEREAAAVVQTTAAAACVGQQVSSS